MLTCRRRGGRVHRIVADVVKNGFARADDIFSFGGHDLVTAGRFGGAQCDEQDENAAPVQEFFCVLLVILGIPVAAELPKTKAHKNNFLRV